MSSLIYVIGHRVVEDRFGPGGIEPGHKRPFDYYKIGIAKNPKQRLKNLQIGTPHDLEIITTIESSNPKRVEELLHSVYFSRQKSGEWFRLWTNDVNSLVALNQLEPEDLDPLAAGIFPEWQTEDTSLYLEVEKLRRGEVDD